MGIIIEMPIKAIAIPMVTRPGQSGANNSLPYSLQNFSQNHLRRAFFL
jgi:hypothetical protein